MKFLIFKREDADLIQHHKPKNFLVIGEAPKLESSKAVRVIYGQEFTLAQYLQVGQDFADLKEFAICHTNDINEVAFWWYMLTNDNSLLFERIPSAENLAVTSLFIRRVLISGHSPVYVTANCLPADINILNKLIDACYIYDDDEKPIEYLGYLIKKNCIISHIEN